MIKITKQTYDNKLLVKLTADSNDELIRNFWTYINYNKDCVKIREGTEIDDKSGLNEIGDWGEIKSGYFRSTPADFLKTLENIELIRLLNKHNLYCEDNQIPVKYIKQSKLLAQKFYDEIVEENVLKEIDEELENV